MGSQRAGQKLFIVRHRVFLFCSNLSSNKADPQRKNGGFESLSHRTIVASLNYPLPKALEGSNKTNTKTLGPRSPPVPILRFW